MKLETKANQALIKMIKAEFPKAIFQKHADRFTSGIPDLEYCLPRGIHGWIENKAIDQLPVRGMSIVSQGLVKPLQVEYLSERARLGVPCFISIMCKIKGKWVPAMFHPLHTPEKLLPEHFRLDFTFSEALDLLYDIEVLFDIRDHIV